MKEEMKRKGWMGSLLASGMALMLAGACSSNPSSAAGEKTDAPAKNEVIETILSRRSIRQFEARPVNRDTMQVILNCGIQAPNGRNKQSWEVRVVEHPATGLKQKNLFHGASTVVFIAHDTSYDCSQVDCGLLGENMILSAWSMGVGSCCLAGPVRFLKTDPEAAEYLKKLDFPDGYELLYCIAFGYPKESPAAKPRKSEKVRFVELK